MDITTVLNLGITLSVLFSAVSFVLSGVVLSNANEQVYGLYPYADFKNTIVGLPNADFKQRASASRRKLEGVSDVHVYNMKTNLALFWCIMSKSEFEEDGAKALQIPTDDCDLPKFSLDAGEPPQQTIETESTSQVSKTTTTDDSKCKNGKHVAFAIVTTYPSSQTTSTLTAETCVGATPSASKTKYGYSKTRGYVSTSSNPDRTPVEISLDADAALLQVGDVLYKSE